jgi:hypothetical protein
MRRSVPSPTSEFAEAECVVPIAAMIQPHQRAVRTQDLTNRSVKKLFIQKAYRPSDTLSNTPPILWRFALVMMFLVILSGIGLVAWLSIGIANPPRAGSLSWQAESAEGWQSWQKSGDFELFSAPLAISSPPFTLELTADNSGANDSAWGVALQNSEYIWKIVVNREGYLSINTDERPHWAEFMHIRRSGDNKLYLDTREDGTATIRINDEIAWAGTLQLSENITWGVAQYRNPTLLWKAIDLYIPQ